ncbi:MAG TPA: YwqI/YxiC family protein [Bacillaceae bacterium]
MPEIKIQYGGVEKALSNIRSAVSSFDEAMPKNIGGSNELDVKDALEEINQLMEKLMKNYTALLAKHEQITSYSVQSMKEADSMISTSYRHQYK